MQEPKEIWVQKEIIIHKNAKDLLRIWRNFENLPRILHFLENVINISSHVSRWTSLLADQTERVIWDIRIVEENENRLEWHSENNPDIFHRGILILTSMPDSSTLLQLQLRFFFPLLHDSKPDMLGSDFSYRIEEDLQRFRLAVEANEFYGVKSTIKEIPEGFADPQNPRKPLL